MDEMVTKAGRELLTTLGGENHAPILAIEEEAFQAGARMAFRIATMHEDHAALYGHADLCYAACPCGPNGELLACCHGKGHTGDHSWASLPTFTAAAPQVAPADGGPYSFGPLTGDGWAINGPGEQERHGDWQADGYGLAIALDRETAVLIVDALNRAASADGALREALDAAALYILASPAVSGPVQEEDRRQVIELLDRALAAADAAPERTLPSVEELEAALEAVDRSGFFERNKVWVGARFYGDALAGAILAALRAEATK